MPCRGFRQIAELLICVGREFARLLVGRIGEHQFVCDLGHKAVLAILEIFARAPDHRIGAAHVRYILFGRLSRRKWIEVGSVKPNSGAFSKR
jgi:hypothetical protein